MTTRTLRLASLWLRRGAVFAAAQSGVEVPRRFGGANAVADELRALSEGAGLIDRSDGGVFFLSGADRVPLLTRLLSNTIPESPGDGRRQCLLDPKGKLLHVFCLWADEDKHIALAPADSRESLAPALDHYVFGEDFAITAVSDALCVLSLVGPRVGETLERVFGAPPPLGEPLSFVEVREPETETPVTLCVVSELGLPQVDLVVSSAAGRADRLVGRLLGTGGVTAVGRDAFEIARIERGRPAVGAELTDAVGPLEAGLEDALDFDKGCYVGQEVVSKMHHRGQPPRRLVGLIFGADTALGRAARDDSAMPMGTADELPAPGATLMRDGERLGWVTSVAHSPRFGAIGLGFVRRAEAELGRTFTCGTAGGSAADGGTASCVPATIAPLPFPAC